MLAVDENRCGAAGGVGVFALTGGATTATTTATTAVTLRRIRDARVGDEENISAPFGCTQGGGSQRPKARRGAAPFDAHHEIPPTRISFLPGQT
jgi:hypothetical protein